MDEVGGRGCFGISSYASKCLDPRSDLRCISVCVRMRGADRARENRMGEMYKQQCFSALPKTLKCT
jgi:hypothetical protein